MLFSVLRRPAALLLLAGLAACSGKNEETTPADDLSWTVDGTAMVSTTSQAKLDSPNIVIDGATGTPTAGTFIRLTVPARVGNYPITSRVTNIFYATNAGSTNTVYFAESGSVTVSSLTNTRIEGTFTFTGSQVVSNLPTKTLTNGSFTLALK